MQRIGENHKIQKWNYNQEKRVKTSDIWGKVPKEESVPYKYESMINFLAGGKIKAKDLFQQSEYESDFSFSISDDMEEILPQLGDDAEFVSKMTAIYEWSVLTDVLNGENTFRRQRWRCMTSTKRIWNN